MRRKRRGRAAELWTVLAAAGLAVACSAGQEPRGLPDTSIGGDLTLTDHDGERFELGSMRGKVVLVFFGYSSCPDACPTTLSKLASVSRRLGDDRARLRTLYISVDPERDTPEVLKADLASYDLDAIGLTGTKAEIDAAVAAFGASYEIVPTPGLAFEYAVGHTTWLYLLDAEGRQRVRFPYEATVEEIVDEVQAVLASMPSGWLGLW